MSLSGHYSRFGTATRATSVPVWAVDMRGDMMQNSQRVLVERLTSPTVTSIDSLQHDLGWILVRQRYGSGGGGEGQRRLERGIYESRWDMDDEDR